MNLGEPARHHSPLQRMNRLHEGVIPVSLCHHLVAALCTQQGSPPKIEPSGHPVVGIRLRIHLILEHISSFDLKYLDFEERSVKANQLIQVLDEHRNKGAIVKHLLLLRE